MLVLTRKLGEEIVLPGLNVSIRLVAVCGKRIRLGVSAPQSVRVLRHEFIDPPVCQPSEAEYPAD